MSYLDDPRVFLAAERTLLSWIRTEAAILAFAFLVKKYGVTHELAQPLHQPANFTLVAVCVITVVLSVLSTMQAHFTLSKLGEKEIPGPMAVRLVMLAGFLSILMSAGMTVVMVFI